MLSYMSALISHVASQVILGSGEFGVVHPGICKLQPVAIKMPKNSVDLEGSKALLAEAEIMAYLGDQEHVVKFVGADVTIIAERKEEFVFQKWY